jgi:hypothetical protein
MGLLQPGARSRVSTPERNKQEIYADAVAACNLPEKERQWRLRHPTSVRSEGRVITVKNEIEYDKALDKKHMRDSTWFATTEIQFSLGVSEEAYDAKLDTSLVQVRTLPVRPHILPRTFQPTRALHRIYPWCVFKHGTGMGCEDKRYHAVCAAARRTASDNWKQQGRTDCMLGIASLLIWCVNSSVQNHCYSGYGLAILLPLS